MNRSAAWLSFWTVLCWGTAAVFDKLAVDILPPKTVFLARFYLVFILMLLPLVLTWEQTRVVMYQSERRAVLYLLGSVVFTIGGMYLYYQALSGSEASKTVPLCSTYPVVTFLLALAFLHEPLNLSSLAGTALVAGGVYLLLR